MFGLSALLGDICVRSATAALRAIQRTQPLAAFDEPSANGPTSAAGVSADSSACDDGGVVYCLDGTKLSKIAERACGLKGAGLAVSASLTVDGRTFPSAFRGSALCEWLQSSGLADTGRTAHYIALRLVRAGHVAPVCGSRAPRVFHRSACLLYAFRGECSVSANAESEWMRLGLTEARVLEWVDAAAAHCRAKARRKSMTVPLTAGGEMRASDLVRFLKRKKIVLSTRDGVAVGQFAIDKKIIHKVTSNSARAAAGTSASITSTSGTTSGSVTPHGSPIPLTSHFRFNDEELQRTSQSGPAASAAAVVAISASESSPRVHWEFIQSFGDDGSATNDASAASPLEAADDLVTAVEFSPDGRFLAIGDKAGRISVVEQIGGFTSRAANSLEYSFFTEFQSHEPEFDSLKSAEISARIAAIEWARYQARTMKCITANEKTIKIWELPTKTTDRKHSGTVLARARALEVGVPRARAAFPPYSTDADEDEDGLNGVHARCRASLSPVHAWPVHSLSCSSDGQTFVSADDLTVLLWNLERTDEALKIIDRDTTTAGTASATSGSNGSTGGGSSSSVSDVEELLTAARFHPSHPHYLAHASSKGVVRLADLRSSCLVDLSAAATFAAPSPKFPSSVSATTAELCASILDLRWSARGSTDLLVARDYLFAHVFDVRQPRAPLQSICIDPRLLDTDTLGRAVASEAVFDAFQCAVSPRGERLVSGVYGNEFALHELTSVTSTASGSAAVNQSTIVRAKDDARDPLIVSRFTTSSAALRVLQQSNHSKQWSSAVSFERACLKASYHPRIDAVAIAGMYKLYLYAMVGAKSGSPLPAAVGTRTGAG